MPLSPSSFETTPDCDPSELPIVPCHPGLRGDALRAIAGSAREAEEVLKNLQRRALELDLGHFAHEVGDLAAELASAREGLGRCAR